MKTPKTEFDCLAVSSVTVQAFPKTETTKILATAQIVLNNQLSIRGLRVMNGTCGLYVSYPLDPFYKGEDFKSICRPISRQLHKHIENKILEKYQEVISNKEGSDDENE